MGSGGQRSTTSNNLPSYLQDDAEDFIAAYRQQAMVDGKPIGRPGDLDQQVADYAGNRQMADYRGGRNMANFAGNRTVSGWAGEQEQAARALVDRSEDAQYAADANTRMATDTVSGKYLHPETNPYLRGTYDAAAEGVTRNFSTAVLPGLMAAGQRSGQFGGSAMNELMANAQGELGDSLGDMGNQIYAGNYAAERDRQMQAGAGMGNTIETGFMPQERVYSVGQRRQDQAQSQYDNDYANRTARQDYDQSYNDNDAQNRQDYQKYQQESYDNDYAARLARQDYDQSWLDTNYANAASRAEWPFNILSGYGNAIGQAAGGGGNSNTRSSGAGFMGSVICTELYRRGLMDQATYDSDTLFGKLLPPEILAGYHRWAIPLARAMSRSNFLTSLIAGPALLWARHMHYRLTGEGKDSLIGRWMMKLGAPLCGWLGKNKEALAHG
jgi:hypothetical protein